MYSVTVVGEIAMLRAGDAGTRNARVYKGTDRERVLTFGRAPTYLRELPPELEKDPMLVVKEVEDDQDVYALDIGSGDQIHGSRQQQESTTTAGAREEDEEDDMEEDSLVVEGSDDPGKLNKSNTPPKRPRRRTRKAK